MITNKTDISKLISHDHEDIIQQIDLPPLSRTDAVRMMYLMCKHLYHFIQLYPTDRDLNNHMIFE